MNLATRLALTFIRRKGSKLPTFTSIMSVLGVSFGVAAFIVVVTVFNSFEHELKQILFAANPNLIIYKFPRGIPDAKNFMTELSQAITKPVERMSMFEYSDALLAKDDRTAVTVLRAVQGTASANAKELDRAIRPEGALATLNDDRSALSLASPSGVTASGPRPSGVTPPAPLPAIILGKALALKLGAKTGDEVRLVSGIYGLVGESRVHRFRVTGIMSIGLAQYDERLALMSFADGVHLFGSPGAAKGIEVKFKDPDDALFVSRELQDKFPYNVRAWQEIDKTLFEQINRDGMSIKMIVFIITLVACFNIIVTLSLSVVDRSKQIALLRGLGASRVFIVRVFVTMGAILGLFGAVLGCVIAAIVLQIFAGMSLGELQAFYFLETIPVEFDVTLFVGAIVVSFVLSFASAFFPAIKATQVSPLHGLKPGY